MRIILTATLIAFSCSGQVFEVASIKASPPSDGRGMRVSSNGGPGTPNPGLYTCENCTLSLLVITAYDIRRYQLAGADSLNADRFVVSAKVPPGTTKEDFRIMQQNLLAERFKLKIHRDKKEMQVYELVVAKNGPKFKESAAVPAEPPPFTPGPAKLDSKGYPMLPPGLTGTIMESGKARWQGHQQSMSQLANMLSNQLGKPVTDVTGLNGKYDLALTWSAEGMRGTDGTDLAFGPTLVDAIPDQLGLKLDQKKALVDIVVVDHADKNPTEN